MNRSFHLRFFYENLERSDGQQVFNLFVKMNEF